MSEAPLATYHVWRRKLLALTRPTGHTGASIVEVFHWFGRADVYPMVGGPNSLERAAHGHADATRRRRRAHVCT